MDKITETVNVGGRLDVYFTHNGLEYQAAWRVEERDVVAMYRIETSWQLTRGTNEYTTPNRHWKSISLKSARGIKLLEKFLELRRAAPPCFDDLGMDEQMRYVAKVRETYSTSQVGPREAFRLARDLWQDEQDEKEACPVCEDAACETKSDQCGQGAA